MPASFDIAGIFDLVAQVLGLTWTRLRGKVVKIIGEKNTERLEFVAQYVQALITGGFSGLWEKIQGDLSGLWDMVVGGIKDWIIQKVVQQAILKIATMWNPAGAIIQLIETAWNVYQWVRENAQRIFGLVQAVVDSISNIVAGNIGGAANFIEASLAKLVPVAISLFADLIGLGGIADKLRGIIEKVQTKVDEAIDKLFFVFLLAAATAIPAAAQAGNNAKKGGKAAPAPLSTSVYDVWTMEQLAKPGNLGNFGNHSCSVQRRDVGAAPEAHDNFAHVMIFTSGTGKFHVGGEIVDGPDGKKTVRGGDERKIVVGEVYHLPIKTAHWVIPDAGSSVTYFVCNLYLQ